MNISMAWMNINTIGDLLVILTGLEEVDEEGVVLVEDELTT